MNETAIVDLDANGQQIQALEAAAAAAVDHKSVLASHTC